MEALPVTAMQLKAATRRDPILSRVMLYTKEVFTGTNIHIKVLQYYVGETENPLHIRMNGHRSDIRTKKLEKSVAAYFSQPDHSAEDLEVRGIEKIHDNGIQWSRKLLDIPTEIKDPTWNEPGRVGTIGDAGSSCDSLPFTVV